jgi:uncharacterized protein YbjT (DUF2867 family)
MKNSLKVLVSGATGNQGGAVVRSLLDRGHQVRALTRNTESTSAKVLAALGVELVQGNFDDAESLQNALTGVDSFYMMGSPMEGGVEAEVKQGIELADAAKAANVGHLVYGSVANASLATGIPHFDSKYQIEQYIKTLGIPYTISAPVFFMDNFVAPWSLEALKAGKIYLAMPGSLVLQQVSVKNIGDFVASIITRRDEVFGQRFDFAGDELTADQSAAMLSETTGRDIEFVNLPLSEIEKQSEDMAAMFKWFDQVGYNVNITALKQKFDDVEWQLFSDWAASHDWAFMHEKNRRD